MISQISHFVRETEKIKSWIEVEIFGSNIEMIEMIMIDKNFKSEIIQICTVVSVFVSVFELSNEFRACIKSICIKPTLGERVIQIGNSANSGSFNDLKSLKIYLHQLWCLFKQCITTEKSLTEEGNFRLYNWPKQSSVLT